jgi:hypothetical protein
LDAFVFTPLRKATVFSLVLAESVLKECLKLEAQEYLRA